MVSSATRWVTMIGLGLVALVLLPMWNDSQQAQFLLVLLHMLMPWWLPMGAFVSLMGGILWLLRPHPVIRTAGGGAAVVACAVVLASLVVQLSTYLTEDARRFRPYIGRIETLLATRVPELSAYPMTLQDSVALEDPPGAQGDGPLRRFVRFGAWRIERLFEGQPDPPRATLASRVACSLLNDGRIIGSEHEGKGVWHLTRVVWSYALLRHFSPEDILRLRLYYLSIERSKRRASRSSSAIQTIVK